MTIYIVPDSEKKARCLFPRENASLSRIRIVNFPRYDLNCIGKCYTFFDTELISSYPVSAGVALPFSVCTTKTGPVFMLIFKITVDLPLDFNIQLEYDIEYDSLCV